MDITKTKDYHKFSNIYITIEKITESFLRSDIYLPFGLCSLNYPVILTEQVPLNAPACTDFSYIYINPNDSFFKECNTNIQSVLTFVLLHEVGHNIFMHKKRGEGKDQILWQYSIDYFLNGFLYNLENERFDDQVNLAVMQLDRYKNKVLFSEDLFGLIEEEIYEKLQKDGSYTKKESQQSYKDFLGGIGLSNNNIPDDSQIKVTKTELQRNKKIIKKIIIEFPQADQTNQAKESNEVLNDDLAKTMFETRILSRGFQSSSFEKFIKRMFSVKVPWDVILGDSILIELQKKGDINYSRPRITWLCNPTMPYLANITEEEVYGTLVLLIDESGSMLDEDISKAVDIAQQSDSYYKNIYVIKHDSQVRWDKLYEDKLTKNDVDELCIRRHSGGTSHKDAFNKVLEFEKNNNTFVSLVLSLTDMCSDLQESQKILPSRIPRIYLKVLDFKTEGIIGKVINV